MPGKLTRSADDAVLRDRDEQRDRGIATRAHRTSAHRTSAHRTSATASDLDDRIEDHDVLRGHAEEFRGARAAPLHPGEEPAFEALPAGTRTCNDDMRADEKRAVLEIDAQAAR